MSDKVVITKSKLDNLANAIATKSGSGVTLTVDEMVETVLTLEADKADPVLQNKTVVPGASQKTVTPDDGYDGLSTVVVKGDNNLKSQNIISGVSIYGVTGSAEAAYPTAVGVIF